MLSKRISFCMVQSSKPICTKVSGVQDWKCCKVRTYGTHGLELGRSLLLEVVGVSDLLRSPDTLVGRVLDHRSGPLALVLGVSLHGRLPRATAGSVITLGVLNKRRHPVTVLFIIPVLGLLGLRVGDLERLVLEPVGGLLSLGVLNLEGSLLIPVSRLLCLGVRDLSLLNPVGGLLVFRVVNLVGGVDCGGEVLEERTGLERSAIDLELEGLIGADDEGVEGGLLADAGHGGVLEVLLLVLASLGVLVAEDEVDLVGGAALVGTEHDDVGRGVGELFGVEGAVILEELHVGTSTLKAG
jgi:hypothetical protein